MSRLTELLRRAKEILQTEGLIPLVRRGFRFLGRCSFIYGSYYVYETDIQEQLRNSTEADFLPRIEEFTFKIISTNQEADELEAQGFEFRSQSFYSYKALDKGAAALCVFVERELASIGWVAMTQEAKNSLGEPPYNVDFLNNEVCHPDSWTNPKYRGRGLAPYITFKATQFEDERGKVYRRSVTRKDNITSNRAYAKLGHNIHAEARFLKILWWEWWKERPLT